jgi:hypothetical protein
MVKASVLRMAVYDAGLRARSFSFDLLDVTGSSWVFFLLVGRGPFIGLHLPCSFFSE